MYRKSLFAERLNDIIIKSLEKKNFLDMGIITPEEFKSLRECFDTDEDILNGTSKFSTIQAFACTIEELQCEYGWSTLGLINIKNKGNCFNNPLRIIDCNGNKKTILMLPVIVIGPRVIDLVNGYYNMFIIEYFDMLYSWSKYLRVDYVASKFMSDETETYGLSTALCKCLRTRDGLSKYDFRKFTPNYECLKINR